MPWKINWDTKAVTWEEPSDTSSGSSAKTVNDPLTGPANIDTSYQFGDWITGRMASKQAQENQAALDYAEYVRNKASAKEQRDWEEYMSNTQVQRTMKDIEKAGLNPWLAVQSAGFGGAVPSGAVASSSAGQVVSGSGNSSPGSVLAGTAVGLAALFKVVKRFLK